MKQRLTTYTFNPAAKTIDFSALAGFDFRGLLAIIHGPSGATLYAAGVAALAASVSGAVVTLNASVGTMGMASADPLLVFYDDGASPASAGAQSTGNASLASIDGKTPALTNGAVPTSDQSYATHAPAYFQATATNAAQSLASLIGAGVPSWATMAWITPESGAAIRYRADGTAPTASVGQPVALGQSWPLQGAGALSGAQIISQGANAVVSIELRG
ncbi:MAG: hypothetical protein KGM42_10725 [Hyphomicrobiales bacterium]|nr:hypothetical protein [Hyphomicrobiales bacterium]